MEFSRKLWVSEKAKTLWEPRISQIVETWQKVERESVYKGMRRGTIQNNQWPDNPKGFITVGFSTTASVNNYSAGAAKPKAGEPFDVRTVTIRKELLRNFIDAWETNDDDAIGVMLGYPICCIDFFNQTWKKGLIDPTSEMESPNHILLDPYCNPFLRWLGVRTAPHMPCSFSCANTKAASHRYMELMPKDEQAWILELLSMPLEYTTLSGIGEVKTPLFKLAFSSQGDKRFEFWGDQPDGTTGGTRFPFVEDTWTNNGFFGPASMRKSHAKVLEMVPPCSSIIDFGCGNGVLLSQVDAKIRVGFDINFAAIQQGRRLSSNISFIPGNFNIFPIPKHELSLISMERFIESPDVNNLLEKMGDRVLVYSYSDGVDEFVKRLKTFFSEWTRLSLLISSHTAVALLKKNG